MGKILKMTGTFDNANVRADNTVTIRFKFPYSEVAEYIQLVTLIGREVPCKVLPDEQDEAIKLGRLSYDRLAIDRDGEAKVTFKGEIESIDLGQLYTMANQSVEVQLKV